ncbi:MAG: hypothetical protein WCK02_05975 [Bacteroidota bacterium]
MKKIIATCIFGFLGLTLSYADNTNTAENPKDQDKVSASALDNQMMSLSVVNTEKTYTYTKEEAEVEDIDITNRLDNEIMSTGVSNPKTYGEVGNHVKINNEYQTINRLGTEKMGF